VIKVLHIIKSLGRGGAETLLLESIKLIDNSNFEFHIIYFLPWKNQMVSELILTGAKVTCLEAKSNHEILLQYKKVINYINNNVINIIHCHMPVTGVLGRIIFKITKIPVIYTEHNLQERYHYLTRVLNFLTYNFQSNVIAVSEEVKKSIEANINPRCKVDVIENGINTDTFKFDYENRLQIRKKYNIPENAIVIGNVAVFRDQKRLPEWVISFSEISKKFSNVYGLLVGDGPCRNQILKAISNYNLSDKLIMANFQTDVKPFYSAIDIFVMTSLYEGLPIALLEAMSMECAIVSTNAGGINTVIRNGLDGFLEDTSNLNELTHKVEKLVSNINLLDQYKKAARNRVCETYDLKDMTKKLELQYYILSQKV
jgi:glycosyltransferase involved in cell wall biosynthesis